MKAATLAAVVSGMALALMLVVAVEWFSAIRYGQRRPSPAALTDGAVRSH